MVKPLVAARYVGKKFGRLTITAFSHKKGPTEYFYHARCDCGNERVVRIGAVQGPKGSTRSCGCLGKEKRRLANLGNTYVRKGFGEASRKNLLSCYRLDAAKRGLSFNLTDETFFALTSSACFYCGCAPYQEHGQKNNYGKYIHNGVDRVDNSKGYEPDNCVPSCGPCNFAKNKVPLHIAMRMVEFVTRQTASNSLMQTAPLPPSFFAPNPEAPSHLP